MTKYQIDYHNYKENQLHNRNMEAETNRANTAKEAENYRHDVESEKNERRKTDESVRHNVQGEILSHEGNLLGYEGKKYSSDVSAESKALELWSKARDSEANSLLGIPMAGPFLTGLYKSANANELGAVLNRKQVANGGTPTDKHPAPMEVGEAIEQGNNVWNALGDEAASTADRFAQTQRSQGNRGNAMPQKSKHRNDNGGRF